MRRISSESVCNKRFLFRDFSIFANSFSVPMVGMISEAAFFFIDFLVSSNQYRAAILANRRRRFTDFHENISRKNKILEILYFQKHSFDLIFSIFSFLTLIYSSLTRAANHLVQGGFSDLGFYGPPTTASQRLCEIACQKFGDSWFAGRGR